MTQTYPAPGENAALQLAQKVGLLLMNADEPLMLVGKDMNILAFNASFDKLCENYFNERLQKGRSVFDYAQLTSKERLKEIYENVFKGQTLEAQVDQKLPGEEVRTYSVIYTPALDENGQIFAARLMIKEITEKVASKLLIAKKEDRYNTLVESISDGFVALDKNLCYTYINRRAANMIRMEPEEVLGRYIWEVFPDAVGSATYQALNKAMAERVSVINIDHYAPLGLWQENHFYPAEDGLFLFIKDITDQRKAEQAFLHSHKLLKKLADKVPVAVYQFEMDAQGKKTFPFMSPALGKLMPLIDPEELKLDGGIAFRSVHPDDHDLLYDSIETSRRQLTDWDLEFRSMDKQGGLIWLKGSAHPEKKKNGTVVWYGYLQNITERKLAEENIKAAKDRYDLVAKATSDAIYDWDLVKNEVLRIGDGLNVLFGYNAQEVGASANFWKDRVHPDDLEKSYGKLETYLLDPEKNLCSQEYRFRRADGSYAVVFDKGFIMRDKEGRAIRMIGATQDISAQKEAEAQLTGLNSTLEKRAEELAISNAELEQFAYIVSHDLQEPLRMITTFLTQLQEKYNKKLDDKARQYIHFANDGAVRMKRIILDLLEYSRLGKESAVAETVDTNDLLYEAVQLNRISIEEKGALIEWKDLPCLPGNRALLQQLFQNLLGNALKYQKPGQKPLIEISAAELADCWQFAFKDNGIGIDPQFFDKIFEVFQRLHSRNEYSGTGIGLAICKKIVENHQGRIWVESTPGEGCTFCFTITK